MSLTSSARPLVYETVLDDCGGDVGLACIGPRQVLLFYLRWMRHVSEFLDTELSFLD